MITGHISWDGWKYATHWAIERVHGSMYDLYCGPLAFRIYWERP